MSILWRVHMVYFFVERVACRHIHFMENKFLFQEIKIQRKKCVKNRQDLYHSVVIHHGERL